MQEIDGTAPSPSPTYSCGYNLVRNVTALWWWENDSVSVYLSGKRPIFGVNMAVRPLVHNGLG